MTFKSTGGNGGKGGDVILECSRSIWDFSGLQHHMVCLQKHHMHLLELDMVAALIAVLDLRSYFINYRFLIKNYGCECIGIRKVIQP
jgi:hypothetical protein